MIAPADAFRELVYRHIRRVATNNVFGDGMIDLAAALGCTRGRVKTAINALVRNGMLTVETRGAGRLASQYRITGPSQAPAATEPPPRRFDVIRASVLDYVTGIATDGEFEARVLDVVAACRITAEQAKRALAALQQDRVLTQVYRGSAGHSSRYRFGPPCDDAEDLEEPPDSARFVAAFRRPRPERRPLERVRLVAPGTYPASGYSMLRAR